MLIVELGRISSHCVWLGTHGIDLGAISAFWYIFDIRENILDLVEQAGGARMHPNYLRIGGVNGDLPAGYLTKLDELIVKLPQRMRELRTLLQNNPIWRDRTIDVGIVSAEEAVSWGLTGPALRGSGIAYDVRKAFPYCGYEKYEFDVPTRSEGDAYARFLVRLDEIDEALRIIRQVRDELQTPGPIMIDDPKIAAPPKETIAISMEALIHHFKIVSEGFRVPPGDVYQAIEGPARRARLLFGFERRQPSLSRAHPSAVDVQLADAEEDGRRQSDRRHRGDDRVARPGLRRGRPVSDVRTDAPPGARFCGGVGPSSAGSRTPDRALSPKG